MQLATFYTNVATALGRGTSLDTRIPGWAFAALQFIEQAFELAYMRKFASLSLSPVVANPDLVNFPSAQVKKFIFMRRLGVGNYYIEIEGTLPETAQILGVGIPTQYWHDGTSIIHFNAKVQAPLTLECMYLEYSDWPSNPALEFPPLSFIYNALFAQTLQFAAQDLRDDRMAIVYTARRDEAFKVLEAAQSELINASTRHKMRFNNAGY
jgi:hypothetical protein